MQPVLRRSAARRHTRLLPAVIACGLLLGACNAVHFGAEPACDAPAQPPAMPALAPADDALRVISWNLNGTPEAGPIRERIRRIAAQVLARRPDVLLLQEVWFEGDARLLASALEGHYVRVPDAAAVSSHFLSPFTGFRAGGLLAFVSSARGFSSSASHFEPFRDAAPWLRERDGIAGKGVQHFVVREGSRRIAFLNVHLQAQYAGPGDDRLHPEVRAQQIDAVRRTAETLEDGATVIVAAGDFNTMPAEIALYGALTGYWTDLTRAVHERCNCGTHIGKLRPDGTKAHGDRWIDYVLVRAPSLRAAPSSGPEVDLIRSGTANCRYSDHHGLDVVFSLP